MAVRLNDIEDITCSYGIWGRILGFGDLTIESAGTYGIIIFKGIPRPKKVKLMIERVKIKKMEVNYETTIFD